MGQVEGKVAFITGAARGQGRSHAVRLAEEGADVVLVDICATATSTQYAGATEDDLKETVRLVEAAGRKAVSVIGDVRSIADLERAVTEGVVAFGHIDIVVANAGIFSSGAVHQITEDQWDEVIGTNLSGVWKTIRATVPQLIEQGTGGSIIVIGSSGGVLGFPYFAHYVAAKHGLIGLTKTVANELGAQSIRSNIILPGSVITPMIDNDAMYQLFRPDLDKPTREDFQEGLSGQGLLPTPWVEPVDVSNAVVWLASDASRFVTGTATPVDAGAIAKV
jgi:SDR family mycofactocin-dependent oxidoreductase